MIKCASQQALLSKFECLGNHNKIGGKGNFEIVWGKMLHLRTGGMPFFDTKPLGRAIRTNNILIILLKLKENTDYIKDEID